MPNLGLVRLELLLLKKIIFNLKKIKNQNCTRTEGDLKDEHVRYFSNRFKC